MPRHIFPIRQHPLPCARNLALLLAISLAQAANAQTALLPSHDNQLIEVLPAANRNPSLRPKRRATPAPKQSSMQLLAKARQHLQSARATADPRFLGRAYAILHDERLRGIPDVLLLRAQVQQSRHEFESALESLKQFLKLQPTHAGAWFLIANIERVRGDLDRATHACKQANRLQPSADHQLCVIDLEDLQGNINGIEVLFHTISGKINYRNPTSTWQSVTLAEMAARHNDIERTERFYRKALLRPNAYVLDSYCRWLLEQRQFKRVIKIIKGLYRAAPELPDSLQLSLALAYLANNQPAAAEQLQSQLKEQFLRADRAGLKPHLRLRSRFELDGTKSVQRALLFATQNWQDQRESADAILLARAAWAADDFNTIERLRQFVKLTGFSDKRLASLLKGAPS